MKVKILIIALLLVSFLFVGNVSSKDNTETYKSIRLLTLYLLSKDWNSFREQGPETPEQAAAFIFEKFKYKEDSEAELEKYMGWKTPVQTWADGFGDCEDISLFTIAVTWKFSPWMRTGLLVDFREGEKHVATVLVAPDMPDEITVVDGTAPGTYDLAEYMKEEGLSTPIGTDWTIIWLHGGIYRK